MKKSKTLCLVISTAVLVTNVSCHNWAKGKIKQVPLETATIAVPYFADTATDYIYKTNVVVYGHEISGVLIIKKIAANAHRIVFTTGFGNKLLDFELSGNDISVNYLAEAFNKRVLINTLKRDFILLLRSRYFVSCEFIPIDSMSKTQIYKAKDGNRVDYLYLLNTKAPLDSLVQCRAYNRKLVVTYIHDTQDLAKEITITHSDIRLKIDLVFIGNK